MEARVELSRRAGIAHAPDRDAFVADRVERIVDATHDAHVMTAAYRAGRDDEARWPATVCLWLGGRFRGHTVQDLHCGGFDN
jgi:hypothetical protein